MCTNLDVALVSQDRSGAVSLQKISVGLPTHTDINLVCSQAFPAVTELVLPID